MKLVIALDLVIGSFDPDYQVAPAVRAARRTPPRNSKRLSDEAKAAIDGLNTGEPITTTDCASKFAAKLGMPCEEAVLTQLTTAGRVRQSRFIEGRKNLWAVTA